MPHILVDDNTYAYAMAFFEQQPELAIDTETTGLRPYHENEICGISVGAPPYAAYFPFRHGEGVNLSLDKIEPLIRLIERKPWRGHNSKFDIHFLHREGYHIPRCGVIDSQLAAHLVNENETSFGLKELGDKYLGPESSRDEEELRDHVTARVQTRGKKAWKGHMWKLPASLVYQYACSDVELTWRLIDLYQKPLREWRLIAPDIGRDLFDEMNRYSLLFAKMERDGVHIDQFRLEQEMAICLPRADELAAQIEKISNGRITNPGSSAQVNSYFQRKSTKANDLERVLKSDPLTPVLKEWRSIAKVLTSYYVPYSAALDQNGVIHTSYNINGTYTGRLSCSNPNMTAVPRGSEDDTKWTARVKNVVIAPPGMELIEIDLSLAELRLASHYGAIAMAQSNNERIKQYLRSGPNGRPLTPMGEIIMSGVDLHSETAARIGTDRTSGKRINFSAVFGIGANKYSDTYGIPLDQAKRDLDAWHRQFPEFRFLYSTMETIAQQQGYIVLDSGRIRRYQRSYETQKGSSNLVQGMVAEVMRKAGLRLSDVIHSYGDEARILLQVHDSWIFAVPEGSVPKYAPEFVHCMTDWHTPPFDFMPPLTADVKFGRYWGDLTPWKG